MKARIEPSFLSGVLTPPPSKSMLHRAIICAALSGGCSIIKNVNYSDDINATINAFKNCGVDIIKHDNHLEINSSGRLNIKENQTFDCSESGSTIRFLIPLFSNTASKVTFTGKPSLLKRPFSVYETLYKEQKLKFEIDNKSIYVEGILNPGIYNIPGDISSQFISGLMFLLPKLKGNSIIKINGKLESENYVKMTVDMLYRFGIKITKTNNDYIIPGNQIYLPTEIDIESDFSQLAFYAVAGIINGDVKLKNINLNSLQGDKKIVSIIENLGGKIESSNEFLRFIKSETVGSIIDVSQIPDLAPILSVLLSLSKGKSIITNAKRLVIKESNRLLSTFNTLQKLGVECSVFEDSLELIGTKSFNGGVFDSYNDHRIAMMLAIASLRANFEVIIENAEVINKSYPDFYKDFISLGGKIELIEE